MYELAARYLFESVESLRTSNQFNDLHPEDMMLLLRRGWPSLFISHAWLNKFEVETGTFL